MKKDRTNIKNSHATKGKREQEHYLSKLQERAGLISETTVKEEKNSEQTSSALKSDTNDPVKKPGKRPKPLGDTFTKFIKKNWLELLFVFIFGTLATFVYNHNRELGVIDNELKNSVKQIDDIQEKIDENQSSLETVRIDNTGLNRDLENLKSRLESLERRILR